MSEVPEVLGVLHPFPVLRKDATHRPWQHFTNSTQSKSSHPVLYRAANHMELVDEESRLPGSPPFLPSHLVSKGINISRDDGWGRRSFVPT